MAARIYKPARSAMQSGAGNTKLWLLEYEPEKPRAIEPVMGWTSSADMKSQIRLRFDTAEEAVAYAQKHGIAYRVEQPKAAARHGLSYSDNFKFSRTGQWTH
jgi:ETC complex I subunit conserved region